MLLTAVSSTEYKEPLCGHAVDVLPRLGPPGPGVFMQGNLVFNARQELIYRRDLDRSVVETAIDFAAKNGWPDS